ncbi:MAG: DUF2238 domain-containing protein [Xanthomonadaceae bacterium]|nr:DUF2238 domain-containing protein [Xanthomonadaceae bacterium]
MVKASHWGLLAFCTAVLVWSGIGPADRATWALEVAPAVVGVGLLVWLYPRWRMTDIAYWGVAAFAVLLMVGGHYTYAEVPLFNWLQEEYGHSRNHFDRLGHFLQGFVPAIVAREVLIRNNVLARPRWMFFIVVSICLAISAFYELIEWWVALFSEEAAESFLGIQGDNWDTQWDMFLALIGASLAMLTLPRWHDRQIRDVA